MLAKKDYGMSFLKTIIQHGIQYAINIEIPEPEAVQIQIESVPKENVPDTAIIKILIRANSGKKVPTGKMTIRWDLPVVDMHGMVYFPPSPEDMGRLPYWWGHKVSCVNSSLPFFILYNRNNHNRFTFGMLNQVPETRFDFEMSELTVEYNFQVERPIILSEDGTWEENLYLSQANLPWQKIVSDYTGFVDMGWPQTKMKVPAEAFDPIFCTWTAIHHDVSQEWILKNAVLAADVGFRTWITDDGWFTNKASFADYRYAGDWKPCIDKFPDFAGHVRQVQGMGFKYLLWVAPFMVGQESAAAKTYGHLLQEPIERLHFANFTPWKREVNQIVGDLLENMMRQFNLDGFKLDFIDSIRPEEIRDHADYATTGEGVYAILSEAVDRLARIKENVLIEFRNPYANLASRRYANLYRASDVPVNFALNRWQVALERLLTPDRAVLLDPALWHPQDTDENVAVTLINTIISVPMVSVDLQKYPKNHLELIRYWISFYNDHRDTITQGEFQPEFYRGFLPLIRFTSPKERIIGVYEDYPLHISDGPLPLWVLNASSRPFIDVLPSTFSGTHLVINRDKFGRIVSQKTIQFPSPCLFVEIGGSLEIRQLNQ
jgi:alpha-galactosidase